MFHVRIAKPSIGSDKTDSSIRASVEASKDC